MKKSRTILALLVAVLMIFTLSACGKDAGETASTASSGLTRVGISWAADDMSGYQDYADAVTKAGGEPVFLPQITTQEEAKAALATVDALVMTGGEDINPTLYNDQPYEKLEEVNDVRDTSDSLLLNEAIAEDFPTLCTCRGMQLLNVVCGGTLYQDIPTQYSTQVTHRDPNREDWVYHNVIVDVDGIMANCFGGQGTYWVNSWHHQGVRELGAGLTVTAYSADGFVEGIVMTDKTYIMGVQFHPEGLIASGYDQYLTFYTNLIAAAQQTEAEQAA